MAMRCVLLLGAAGQHKCTDLVSNQPETSNTAQSLSCLTWRMLHHDKANHHTQCNVHVVCAG